MLVYPKMFLIEFTIMVISVPVVGHLELSLYYCNSLPIDAAMKQ